MYLILKMKQKIKTNTGKEIDLPARIFTKRDLKKIKLEDIDELSKGL